MISYHFFFTIWPDTTCVSASCSTCCTCFLSYTCAPPISTLLRVTKYRCGIFQTMTTIHYELKLVLYRLVLDPFVCVMGFSHTAQVSMRAYLVSYKCNCHRQLAWRAHRQLLLCRREDGDDTVAFVLFVVTVWRGNRRSFQFRTPQHSRPGHTRTVARTQWHTRGHGHAFLFLPTRTGRRKGAWGPSEERMIDRRWELPEPSEVLLPCLLAAAGGGARRCAPERHVVLLVLAGFVGLGQDTGWRNARV